MQAAKPGIRPARAGRGGEADAEAVPGWPGQLAVRAARCPPLKGQTERRPSTFPLTRGAGPAGTMARCRDDGRRTALRGGKGWGSMAGMSLIAACLFAVAPSVDDPPRPEAIRAA